MGIESKDIILVLLGFLGTVGGALFSYWLIKRSERNILTFEFHKEFNSEEFSKHRRIAHRLIQKYPKKSFKEVSYLDEDKSISLYVLMRFYQRLWLAIDYNRINRKHAREFFSDIFIYWYFISFKENLVQRTEWSIGKNIEALAKWFRKKVSVDEWNTSKKRAENDLNEWINKEGEASSEQSAKRQ